MSLRDVMAADLANLIGQLPVYCGLSADAQTIPCAWLSQRDEVKFASPGLLRADSVQIIAQASSFAEPLKEKQIDVRDEKMFLRCVKAGFEQRRKTLLNSLSSAGGTNKDKVREILEAADIDPGRRAETLTVEEFGRIADGFTDGQDQENS